MKTIVRAISFTLTLLSCLAVSAQSTQTPAPPPIAVTPALTPADTLKAPDSETPTQFGMRYADFVQVNEAKMKTALEDPAIVELSRQIEDLIAQREELIVEAACRKHPETAVKIRTMHQKVKELKKKKADQDEQARAFGNSQPVTPKS